MMQAYILDTSFVMAYIIQSDSNHDRVIRWSSTIHLDESIFYISDFIYAELLTVINRKTPGIYTQSLDAFMA
jgi:predicted nucleic acid-binding protein